MSGSEGIFDHSGQIANVKLSYSELQEILSPEGAKLFGTAKLSDEYKQFKELLPEAKEKKSGKKSGDPVITEPDLTDTSEVETVCIPTGPYT